MRRVLHRLLPAATALLVVLLLGGCARTVVVGTASPGPGEPRDVAARDFPIVGDGGGAIDQIATNALGDLNAFWA